MTRISTHWNEKRSDEIKFESKSWDDGLILVQKLPLQSKQQTLPMCPENSLLCFLNQQSKEYGISLSAKSKTNFFCPLILGWWCGADLETFPIFFCKLARFGADRLLCCIIISIQRCFWLCCAVYDDILLFFIACCKRPGDR